MLPGVAVATFSLIMSLTVRQVREVAGKMFGGLFLITQVRLTELAEKSSAEALFYCDLPCQTIVSESSFTFWTLEIGIFISSFSGEYKIALVARASSLIAAVAAKMYFGVSTVGLGSQDMRISNLVALLTGFFLSVPFYRLWAAHII